MSFSPKRLYIDLDELDITILREVAGVERFKYVKLETLRKKLEDSLVYPHPSYRDSIHTRVMILEELGFIEIKCLGSSDNPEFLFQTALLFKVADQLEDKSVGQNIT